MKAGVSCVALGFGLFTTTLVALAQTTSPGFVAQAPSSTPPSGLVATPPAAPVSVPPSGVLTTVERRAGNALPIKTAQNTHNQRHAPATMRRHAVYHPSASRRGRSTRRTILAQNTGPALPLVSPAPDASLWPPPEGRFSEPQQSSCVPLTIACDACVFR
jgi:hypothetical protein